MNRLIVNIVALVALIAILFFGGVLAYLKIFKKQDAGASSVVTVESIKKIAQLSTIEYTIQTIESVKKEKQWFVLFDTKFSVVLKGKVKGSIDLKKMKTEVDQKNKTVNIIFAKGSIVVSNPEIGKDDIHLRKCIEPWVFNKIDEKDWEEAHKAAIAKIREIALEDGIELKTAKEAQTILTGFIQSFGFKVSINFEDIIV